MDRHYQVLFEVTIVMACTLSLVMVIFSLLPVPLSDAATFRMPLASISKVTCTAR